MIVALEIWAITEQLAIGDLHDCMNHRFTTELRPEGTCVIHLVGDWQAGSGLPSAEELKKEIALGPAVTRIVFDSGALEGWDSRLLAFLADLNDFSVEHRIQLSDRGLPEGARRLLRLATAVPEAKDTGKAKRKASFLSRVGRRALDALASATQVFGFIGEASLGWVRLLGGRARFRRGDFLLILQDCGAQALPIVTLISLLVGLILAFVGAVQLEIFGAQIYIASLVAIATVREMGAMMTAVIMAGRTGAAFAAQLGTMQVNEEIDALKTLGVSPMEFLVVPRMVALVLMMPLLTLYADLVGILGGLIVGVGAFDISTAQYIEQTRITLSLTHISLGVGKSVVFGMIVAVSGCMRGMQCGRSATEVGYAATSAVVTAIVWIIVADGLFAVMTNVLNI